MPSIFDILSDYDDAYYLELRRINCFNAFHACFSICTITLIEKLIIKKCEFLLTMRVLQ